jgi:TonB family protein
MNTFAVKLALVLIFSLIGFAKDVQAQDSIDAARELYASAQYDEALRVLERLTPAVSSTDDRQSIDLYRTLCLFAVGRRDEAERAIEAIFARDPLYRPVDDLSPRLRIAFSDAKKRVVPTVVQQLYADAKAAFDRKDFETAADEFKRVIDALNDPDIGAAASQPPLADLRTLAAGFHDLSVKAIAPPPPPPAPEPPPAPVVAAAPKIYGGEEAGLRPPVTLAQDVPRYPGIVPAGGIRGIIEVIIDERGSVESAVMVLPVGNAYDKIVLSAATKWQFSPALLKGEPVKFRKRVQINIAPPTR